MFKKILFICLLAMAQKMKTQPVLSPNISKAKLTEQQRLNKNIAEAFALPITQENSIAYSSAFWAMMLMEQKPAFALPKIKEGLQQLLSFDNEFRNDLLEVVYALYEREFEKEIAPLLPKDELTPKQFAVCGEYLLRANRKKHTNIINEITRKKIRNRVIDSVGNHFLYYAALNLNAGKERLFPNVKLVKESLQLLFTDKFFANKNVVISLQNKNRNYPGVTIIKDSLGNIVKQNDTILYVPQLTRAVTNLPYYISNGNTPQGVFRINGFGNSKNSQIGPTDNFQLCMPYECNIQDFVDDSVTHSAWDLAVVDSFYKSIDKKGRFKFLSESFVAGMLGRFEIIAHGTTVNNEYYKGKPYYGFTPTMGCLQAKEVWDYNSGKRVYSDQQKLIDAYKSIGGNKGYLVVLNIIDENRPVNINDFKKLLQ